MKYKMIALDMDGTLLNEQKIIPDENKAILRKLYDMGIHIVIATGRTYRFAMYSLKSLDMPVIVISNNGNSMWDPANDRKLAVKYITPHIFYEIAQMGEYEGLNPILHVDHYEEGIDYIIEQNANEPAHHAYLKSGISRCRQIDSFNGYLNPKVMMMCYPGELNKLKRFEEAIRSRFPEKVHTHIALALKSIGPLLEISTYGGTKWHAIVEYAASHNINLSEIIAIGDDNNDAVMLSHAGLGIAMANASDLAKKAASLVSPYSNMEAGVAKILSEIYDIPL